MTNTREGIFNVQFDVSERTRNEGPVVKRWLWALIAIVVLVAIGAFFWPTIHRTIVAPHVAQAPAPAPAPVAQNSPSTPPSAPVAQSSPPASAPAAGSQTSPAPASAASAPAPAPAQTPAPPPAAQSPAPAGATAGQAAEATTGSNDKAATELASLKPGFSAKALVSALNNSDLKFNFASASAEVPAEMTDFLRRAADEMKRLSPGQVLEIAGYTDSSGNPAKNVTLSLARAAAVRDALIKDGANPDMLVAKGYGSADPIASNDTPEGRARNRRIEFHVVKAP
jgi:outer membrane protein OmpA-like peptidoglycan-associated protein